MSDQFGKMIVMSILFFSLILIWILFFNQNIFNSSKDNADYAQMGRQLKNGMGFSTLQIFPKHIPFLEKRGLLNNETWPNLYRYPLPVIVNALMQIVIQDPVLSAIVQSGIWVLLGALLIFLIIHKTSGLYQALFVAALFFLDSLIFSYSGLSEPATSSLLLMIIFLLIVPEDKMRVYLLAGFVSGLLYLTRTQYIFVAILITAFFIFKKIPLRKIFAYVLLFVLTITPWLIRNYNLTGNPFFSFTVSRGLLLEIPGVKLHPELSITSPATVKKSIGKSKSEILRKVKSNLNNIVSLQFWKNMFSPLSLLIPLLLISLFFKSRYRFLSALSASAILINFLILSAVFHSLRYYFPLRSLLIISSMTFLFYLITKIKLINKSRYSGILLNIIAVIILVLFSSSRIEEIKKFKKGNNLNYTKIYDYVINNTEIDDVIASDISHRTSLYTNRRSLRAPSDLNEIEIIDNTYLNIDYLIIRPGRLKRSSLNDGFRKTGMLFGKFKLIKVPFKKYLAFKRVND